VDFSKSIDKSTIKGKTAFVTGGSSGIGAATAKALAEAGAIVTIADINAEAGEKYAAELRDSGSRYAFKSSRDKMMLIS
jgi:NAD(P)-dependent dehydrogenase (short-subunit alcohol dehydrogenase family)